MKLEQATIENTKVGDKCYIEAEVKCLYKLDVVYPIRTNFGVFSEKGKSFGENSPQLYHIKQEEIPTIGECVEMEVSDYGDEKWFIKDVIAKTLGGIYITSDYGHWKYARPIQLTLEQKYENLLKENDELKQKLSKM